MGKRVPKVRETHPETGKPICGAKTDRENRFGEYYCLSTSLLPNGRCYHHGGETPAGAESPHFKHGRYADYTSEKVKSKLARADDGDDPMDLLPELDLQRALFAEYLSRFQDGTTMLTAGDLNMLMQFVTDIGRMVERITKMRNETALTHAEVKYLAARISDVVRKHIYDPAQQQAFIYDLFAELPAGD